MLHIHPGLLPSLTCEGSAHPIQGLLIGTRELLFDQTFSVAKELVPFGDHGQELSSLINYYLTETSAIVGFTLIVSQEVDINECALSYFRSILDALCRVVPANCDASADMTQLSKEIQFLVQSIYGLIIIHREGSGELESEFTCSQVDCPVPLVQEILSGHPLIDPDDSILLLSNEVLAEMDPIQYDILATVQEESQLKDVLAAANIEFGGVSSGRKARRHRSAAHSGETVDESLKEISIIRVPFEIIKEPNPFNLILEQVKHSTINSLSEKSSPFESESLVKVECETPSLEEKKYEYEVLLTWLKALSQPDEVVLKKISSLEDYEERMKKLGTRLKQSLSPEDLIKTLASIQPVKQETTSQ